MTEKTDFQACERCSKEQPIETMTIMEDCWFCQECVAAFQEQFDACEHSWEPHTDVMGDAGQYCSKCTGFVRDEDMPVLFGTKPDGGTALERS